MNRRNIRDIIAGCLLVVSIVLAVLSSLGSYPARRSEVAARRIERSVNRRMAKLDRYVVKALQVPQDEWLELEGLPDDMVIYRYVNDSLQSWCNRFPVMNDDVRSSMMFDAITNPRSPGRSPLTGIGKDVGFCNLGPKWYLAKAVDSLNVRIVAGLEIVNTNSEVARPYTVQPISYSEGNAISINGEPKFKIAFESTGSSIAVNSGLLFIALILLALSGFIFLFTKPTLGRFWVVCIPILPLVAVLQFWGREIGNDIPLFSPTVYADSGAFYSLGAQLNYLVAILLSISFLYIVRRDVFRASQAMQKKVFDTENIEILWNCNTQEVLGDGFGVTGARLLRKDGTVFDIDIDGFFLAIGHHPNSELFAPWVETDANGYIVTEGKSSRTRVEGVFAAGDVQDSQYRQAITAAASGCMAARDAEKFLLEI